MISEASEVLPNIDSGKVEDIPESKKKWWDIHVFSIIERTQYKFFFRDFHCKNKS